MQAHTVSLLIIVFCIVMSAYFSATETAFSSLNRIKMKNMAEKGNGRSNAKISDEDIMAILGKKGSVKVFEESYKAFTTGKSDLPENAERLFLCTCRDGA